jgi:hypothetical protein
MDEQGPKKRLRHAADRGQQPRASWPRLTVLFIGMLLGVAACHQQTGNPASGAQSAGGTQDASPLASGSDGDDLFDTQRNPNVATGVALDPETLTPSQRKYGIAPARDPRVTYAPGVILLEQGDQAIRGIGEDGITWTFDAASPHVSDFEEGKIIFATGRAVGRIGQLTRSGDAVTVKLAPVQITEVIQDGHFISNTSMDFSKSIIYEAPEFPAVIDFKAAASAQPTRWDDGGDGQYLRTATQLSGLLGTGLPTITPITPPPGMQAMSLSGNALQTFPLAGSDGSVGVGFGYHKGGLNMEAWGQLALRSASIKFELDIKNFKIVTAGMDLEGATSLKIRLQAWSDGKEVTVNASQLVELPADIYIPIPIAGVPLGITVHTSFAFSTAFSAKNSVLTAEGDYTVSGKLFIGFRNGTAQDIPLPKASASNSLANNLQGASVGINSLAISFKVEPMIGIGAFGFNTGVYVGLSFGGSVVRQSDVALTNCRAAWVNGVINGGVGYQLPAKFVAVINGILSVFTKYQISGSGHLLQVPDRNFMQIDESIPPNCASQGKST